jgi:geranylgeranyl diphosphate synthase type I
METYLQAITDVMLPKIEAELKTVVSEIQIPALHELNTMLSYHLGWDIGEVGKPYSGKRIRPLLLLFCTAAAGGNWQAALPAAASLELVHNFSLIHDDIQDNSPMRRGRPSVWTRWGIPQAINAGDAMYSLAYLAMLRLSSTSTNEITLQATRILLDACLRLTEGQYLDIAYETRSEVTLEDYRLMIGRKTANLISACTKIGALIASRDEKIIDAFHRFGFELGLAFQIQDDLLGIWGNVAITGKSNESDLITRKKSFPVIYGLSLKGKFAQRWRQAVIQPQEVAELAAQLEKEGVLEYGVQEASRHTQNALTALESANPKMPAGEALRTLTLQLLKRST